jgi:hypothetical protein
MLEYTLILRRMAQLYVMGVGIRMDSAQNSGTEPHSTPGTTRPDDLAPTLSPASCPKAVSTFFVQITGLESTFHFFINIRNIDL